MQSAQGVDAGEASGAAKLPAAARTGPDSAPPPDLPEPTGSLPPGRPAARSLRAFKAYRVTFTIVFSYLALRLEARFRSPAGLAERLRQKHVRNARRIRRAILELQGFFIKVGQLISIMTNFLPDEFRRELEGLQDRVPPRPYADIERRLCEELGGRAPGAVFETLDERPIASASIGQVHRARLKTGEEVAVKVQYPDIEELVRLDLKMLRRILSIVSWFVPYQGLDAVYREIREMILQELDFRAEADNLEKIAANFRGRRNVQFPGVFRELSTARLLITGWEHGIKVSDISRIDHAGLDRSHLARLIVTAYCQQIFSDGLYHADPHPGNLLVRQAPHGPTIVFLDFGAVAEVSERMRRGIVEFLQGAIKGDTSRIVLAMKTMGFIAKGADTGVFDRVVEYFHERFQEEITVEGLNLKDIKFDPEKGLENLADLRRMDISLRDVTDAFHVPREWIMLERTLLLLLGLCTTLDPRMNPMAVIRPYLEEFVLGKDRDVSQLVMDTTRDLALSALALPGEMKRFMARAQRGELEMRFKNLDEHARLLYTLGHQLIYTACGLVAAVFGFLLRERGQHLLARDAAYTAAGFGALVLGSMLGVRARGRRARKRR